jgi:hypothetical protein
VFPSLTFLTDFTFPESTAAARTPTSPWTVGDTLSMRIVTLPPSEYVGTMTTEQFHVLLGNSTDAISTLGEIVWQPSSNVQAWFSSSKDATPTSPAIDPDSALQRAEWEVLKLTNYLAASARPSIRENFSRLVAAIKEDAEPININIESVRAAFGFLRQIKWWAVTPQFSLTDDGNIYMHWFDGGEALVGITFKPDGRAVWSASQSDHLGRMADAGERPAGTLVNLLPAVAPWVFVNADDSVRRRVAG